MSELEAKGIPNPQRAASDELLPKYKRSLKKLLQSRLFFALKKEKRALQEAYGRYLLL